MQYKEQESHSWWKLVVVLGWIFLIGSLSVFSGTEDITFNFNDPNTILKLKIMQGVCVFFVFIVPAIVFALAWTNGKTRFLGIAQWPDLKSFIFSGLGILFALPLINWLATINAEMTLPATLNGIEEWMKQSEAQAKDLTEAFTGGNTIDVLIINMIVIALLAGLSEELFFRGVLQNVLHECIKNKHVAVWSAAILFSAFHLQFYGFLPRMLMGAYLGYLFLWSGSLWTSIFAHFVNNGMAVLMMWLSNRGAIDMDVEEIGSKNGEWVAVLMSSFLVVASLYFLWKHNLDSVLKEQETIDS